MYGLGTFRAGRRRSGGLVPPQALRPLLLAPASVVAGRPTDGSVMGATSGSTLVASVLPSGFTLDGAARRWRYDGSGSARAASFTLTETLAGAANSPRETVATVTVAAAALTGFASNGSTNPALKAMLARVAAGAGRGRIVFKGDSTTMGQGGGLTAGQSNDPMVQGASAALYRPSAILAAQLTGAGYPALDLGFVGSNGTGSPTGNVEWLNYDPRVSYEGTQWALALSQNLAGGALVSGGGAGVIDLTPPIACDRFEAVFYNVGGTIFFAVGTAGDAANVTITAPGAAVSANTVALPSTSNGFTRVTVAPQALSTNALRMVPTSGTPFLRSARGWNGAVPAIDIINHASGGANSTDQASVNASGNAWNNNEALAFDAPDLTIVNLGLNDPAGSPYATNLQTLITTAKASGDVLLVSPHPASPSFKDTATQVAQRDAAAGLAASNGVAYLDLYAYFGSWAAIASRSADGLVHLNRGGYAEIGQVYRQCIQAMAA